MVSFELLAQGKSCSPEPFIFSLLFHYFCSMEDIGSTCILPLTVQVQLQLLDALGFAVCEFYTLSEWLRAWDTLTMLEATVSGRSCVQSPTGAIMSFSYDQVTGTVFSSEHAFPSKFWIYLEHCTRGEAVIYRQSEPFLYEVASHVKKLPFRPLLLWCYQCSLWAQNT